MNIKLNFGILEMLIKNSSFNIQILAMDLKQSDTFIKKSQNIKKRKATNITKNKKSNKKIKNTEKTKKSNKKITKNNQVTVLKKNESIKNFNSHANFLINSPCYEKDYEIILPQEFRIPQVLIFGDNLSINFTHAFFFGKKGVFNLYKGYTKYKKPIVFAKLDIKHYKGLPKKYFLPMILHEIVGLYNKYKNPYTNVLIGQCYDPYGLIFEYYEKGSLQDLLNFNIFLSPPEKIKYITDLLQSVDIIHSRGLAYNKIKPKNIFITNDDCSNISISLLETFDEQLELSLQDSMNDDNSLFINLPSSDNLSKQQTDIYDIGTIIEKLFLDVPPAQCINNVSDNNVNLDIICKIVYFCHNFHNQYGCTIKSVLQEWIKMCDCSSKINSNNVVN